MLLALAYAISAFVVAGTGLHDQIVPLWIPAGIGLAAVIRFGGTLLPGVFLGNLLFNLWLPFSVSNNFSLSLVLTALAIATGATLHAFLASNLINRYHAHPLRPQSVQGLLKFILFAGFLTCVVSATIGSSTIYLLSDSQGSAGFWNDWLSWWMGDAFGAIIVTPLVLAVFELFGKKRPQRHIRLILQLSMVIVIVLMINQLFLTHLFQQFKRNFEQDVRVLDAQLQAIVQQNFADLSALGQAFSGPVDADPAEFRSMVLAIQEDNPSVLAYSWDPIVLPEERDDFERETRQLLNIPDFSIYGDSLYPDDPLIPVQFVEPIEYNRPALGFNLLSIDDRRRWVIKAQEEGRPIVTQILNLTQAPDEPGMLILHPVYKLLDQHNPLIGNKQLTGFMVGVFTVQRMFNAALEQSGVGHITFTFYEQGSDEPFFYNQRFIPSAHSLSELFTVNIAQQTWIVEAKAGSTYFAMNHASNAQLMQTLLVIVGCMGSLLVLSMHDRERLLTDLVNSQTKTLAHQARHDLLTGLPNRYMLMERASEYIDRSPPEPFSLLFIDLDRFKMINDSLGHQVGDKLLQQMSHNLEKRMVSGCELFRTGGDEFILMVHGDIDRGTAEAERFLNLCTIPLQIEGHKLQMTCSIGISHFPDQAKDLDTLIKFADTAMYKAKAQGKNCIEVYSTELTEEALTSFQLEQDLRVAITTDQLQLHFQPQFSLLNEEICGLEVLIRWHHPEKGLMMPGAFIPLAEETNLIVPLGWQIIELACQQIVLWQEQGLMVPPVAINISPKQLLEADFIQHINAIVDRFGIVHGQIELEITEGVIMQDPDYTILKLNQLREEGYRLAIDDFGTGYSSLNRLKQLPLDRLKIDYSFTRDIGTNPRDEAIILTVIALGKSLNIEVVAEGVETDQQRRFLKANGCDSVQGYLMGHPVPVQDVSLQKKRHHADNPAT